MKWLKLLPYVRTKRPADLGVICRHIFSINADAKTINDSIDTSRIDALLRKYSDQTLQKNPWLRYLVTNRHVWKEVFRVYKLGLNGEPSQRILDIGTGPGLFPFTCHYYGHYAIGTDTLEVPIFAELTEVLGIKQVKWQVEPMVPAPQFGERFDLVTAFMVAFDGTQRPSPRAWTMNEWEFFLQDLVASCIARDGRIFLTGVRQCIKGNEFYDKTIVRYFRDSGGTVSAGNVYLGALSAFR